MSRLVIRDALNGAIELDKLRGTIEKVIENSGWTYQFVCSHLIKENGLYEMYKEPYEVKFKGVSISDYIANIVYKQTDYDSILDNITMFLLELEESKYVD